MAPMIPDIFCRYFAMQIFFGSVKKWSASLPPSRPTPLCFIPPTLDDA